MILRKEPGPYEDTAGLMTLATMLGVALIINLYLKIQELNAI